MNHRNTASFGKRQEYIAVAQLLQRGFDVYMTLVDDQQIDCVVRQEKDARLRYLDVQIKARSKEAKHPGTFAALVIRKPRPGYWFIFHSEAINTYWIMTAEEVVANSTVNKGGKDGAGKNKGKRTIVFVIKTKRDGVKAHPKFRDYENAFHRLNWGETTGSADLGERNENNAD
jgi:hypothetical protein